MTEGFGKDFDLVAYWREQAEYLDVSRTIADDVIEAYSKRALETVDEIESLGSGA